MMVPKSRPRAERPLTPRAHPRCQVQLQTALVFDNGHRVDFSLVNISAAGFAGFVDAVAPIGSEVDVHLPTIGTVKARIAWQLGRAVGVKLITKLTVPQVMTITLRHLATEEGSDG